jgi:hypothetical protein
MHPGTIHPKKKTVLASALGIGLGLTLPAQPYSPDSTVSSANPGACISYAGGYSPGPHLAGSNLKVIDASLAGDLTRKLSFTINPHNRILNFQTAPRVDYFLNLPPAASVGPLAGISPQGSLTLQGGIPSLNMSDGTTLLSGSSGTTGVIEPTPGRVNSFVYVAGSNFTDHINESLTACLGMPRQTATDHGNPGFGASFASAPGAFTSTMVPGRTRLNHLTPFSSSLLLLLGRGLLGWRGCVTGGHAKGDNRALKIRYYLAVR